jgi:ribosome biogenesis ATPase
LCSGVLLRGPPGCGKTHIANAIAGQLNVTFYKISAPEIVSSMSGESESRLRDLFSVASSTAPSIIFMDEIDAIAPKRGGDGSSSGGSKSMEKRIVAQLLTCMDSLTPDNNRNGAPVMILGATNRPDSIDSALRRAGRFDREIVLGVPDEEGRESILKVMTSGMRLSGDIDFKLLAKKTPGFVGADIRSLTKEAGVIAINRIFKKILIDDECNNSDEVDSNSEQPSKQQCNQQAVDFDIHSITPFTTEQMEPLSITMYDFLQAVPHVQPSSKREGFATVPDVSWDNIGALQCIREELSLSVLEPIMHPEKFKALGLPLPAGVLLYGPPGCGKVSVTIFSIYHIQCN